MNCRFCTSFSLEEILDLGKSPLANAYLENQSEFISEKKYPLKLKICNNCLLVQTEDYIGEKEIFTKNYAYFSSTSSTWINHTKNSVYTLIDKFKLNQDKFIIEIGSNDGYLLQFFTELNIPCIGIEPTESTANAAKLKNIETIVDFFSYELSLQISASKRKADLIIANNVYAHVPSINDFTKGLKNLLAPSGTISLEFPHLLNLVQNNLFDTVYHEHFSYISLLTLVEIFKTHGLKIYDVEKLETHGGSLRIFACHLNYSEKISKNVDFIISEELNFGLHKIESYKSLQNNVDLIKNNFIEFLLHAKKMNKLVVGFGAAAKANVILNYSGINSDLISFVVDSSMSKQNKFLPGSHIPIYHPSKLYDVMVDYCVIFPWNIADEIINSHKQLQNNGTQMVTVIPEIKFL